MTDPLTINPTTATVAELKQAEKLLHAARMVAECRENGHYWKNLRITFSETVETTPTGDIVDSGQPAGLVCDWCGATWWVTSG